MAAPSADGRSGGGAEERLGLWVAAVGGEAVEAGGARRWCLLLLLAEAVGLVAECCCRCSWWRRWSAGWNGAVAVQRGRKLMKKEMKP